TWVAGIEEVSHARSGELIEGSDPAALARALGERLRAIGALSGDARDHPPLPSWTPGAAPAIWVVAEMGPAGPRAITRELLAKAAQLAGPLGSSVEAIVIGSGAEHAAALAAAGADRVLVADEAGLEPYTTESHAAVLADAIHDRKPRLVLLGSTRPGRGPAPRGPAPLGPGPPGRRRAPRARGGGPVGHEQAARER